MTIYRHFFYPICIFSCRLFVLPGPLRFPQKCVSPKGRFPQKCVSPKSAFPPKVRFPQKIVSFPQKLFSPKSYFLFRIFFSLDRKNHKIVLIKVIVLFSSLLLFFCLLICCMFFFNRWIHFYFIGRMEANNFIVNGRLSIGAMAQAGLGAAAISELVQQFLGLFFSLRPKSKEESRKE